MRTSSRRPGCFPSFSGVGPYPVLDPWRISVASHMARYQDGRITADQVSLYMLSNAGRKGREAMLTLQNDPQFISNPKRQREINGLLSGNAGGAGKMTAAMLENRSSSHREWLILIRHCGKPCSAISIASRAAIAPRVTVYLCRWILTATASRKPCYFNLPIARSWLTHKLTRAGGSPGTRGKCRRH